MSERGDTQAGERPDGWDGVVRPDPVAPASKPVPAIVADAADLKALRSAVVDAASVGAGLWVSYLFALFYLLVAAGAVTHRDLFFESPVRLPFLGVDLPLKGFFILGPALFLIVHAYVLLHFAMLSGKVRAFDRALRDQIEDAGVQTDLRRQLPSNIFVQYLAGPEEIRNGFMGFCLWLIALISLVVGPVLLLMFFELQFLPYHHQGITWWQRIAVGIDLGLMWLFWRRIALLDGRTNTPDGGNRSMAVAERVLTGGAMWGLTGVAGLMMLVFATFPGEPIDTLWWKSSEQMSASLPAATSLEGRIALLSRQSAPVSSSPVLHWVRRALVAGEVNPASRVPESVWSNRLVLPGLNVVTHLKLDSEDKIAFLPETVSLRERNLDGAVLSAAVLRKADFTGASMRGALLDGADLRQARLTCADWDVGGRNPICTQLQGAFLFNAQLQGASLDRAQLQGAFLIGAQLQGAFLIGAQLQGASLNSAQLQGASLYRAQLQGAFLFNAQLQGASLDRAQLQGASLYRAQLQGASLDRAQLQGASLDRAQLQGASLDRAQLQGASLRSVFVWRADALTSDTRNAWIEAVRPYRSEPCDNRASNYICDFTAESFQKLRTSVAAAIPEGRPRNEALRTIDERLDPSTDKQPIRDEVLTAWWSERNMPLAARADHETEIAKQWLAAGCSPAGAPHVVSRMARRMDPTLSEIDRSLADPTPFSEDRPHPADLARAFLADTCEGAKGLSDDDKARLRRIATTGAATSTPPPSIPTP